MARSSRDIMDIFCGREEKKRRGKKRPAMELSPSLLPPKKRRMLESAFSPGLPVALTHEMVLEGCDSPMLLGLLGEFLCRRCPLVKDLSPDTLPMWLRDVDTLVSMCGAQCESFICPGSLVFLYMVCRDTVSERVSSMEELRTVLLTCFYASYAYIGHSIGYPALPFIAMLNRQEFWRRTLEISIRMSQKMLHINISPHFFAQVLADLINRTDY